MVTTFRSVTSNWLTAALALAVYACAGTPSDRQGAKDTAVPTTPSSTPQATTDCVRGEPDTLFASRSTFKKSSPGEATETAQTNSPIQLTVRHFGCAHYALDFDFVWSDTLPPPNIALVDAARLLESLPVREAYGPVMKTLLATIRKMADEPHKQPVTMSETETLTATTPTRTTLRIRYDVAL